jgi:hypothetical protein
VLSRTFLQWLRRSQQEAKRLETIVPKWLVTGFAFVAMGLFMALATTSLREHSYVVFLAFWIFFAGVHTRARKLYPQAPDFALFMGWFGLACMGALIGFMIYKTEFSG